MSLRHPWYAICTDCFSVMRAWTHRGAIRLATKHAKYVHAKEDQGE